MKVKKEKLLLIAGIVWIIAGVNILNIGFQSYVNHVSMLHVVISLAVFCAFWFMVFSKLVIKHTARIVKYEEEKQFALKFFDAKSYVIMVVMMTMGITVRVFSLVPITWIAVFYSGLGTAILGAGLMFAVRFYTTSQKAKKGEYVENRA